MKQHLSALSEQCTQFATAVDQELQSSGTFHKKYCVSLRPVLEKSTRI